MARRARNLVLIALITAVVACLLTMLVLAPLSPARSAERKPTPGPLLGDSQRTFLDGTIDTLGTGISPGDFSPDGTRIAFELALNVVGLWSNDGTLRTMQGELPFFDEDGDQRLVVVEVRWSGNGRYVVVGVVDRFDGGHYFWRFSPDADPVELTPDKISGGPVFDTDPGRRSAAYVFVEDGDLYAASARDTDPPEPVTTRRGPDISGVSWSADGDGLYLLYDGATKLGVVDAAGGRVSMIRDLTTRRSGESPTRPMASPDGRYVAWNTENADGQTRVVRLSDPTRRPVVLQERHWSWQPCFDGECAKFGSPDAIPGPRAADGEPGGPATVLLSWRAATPGSRPLSSYQLRAVKLDDDGDPVERLRVERPTTPRQYTWELERGRYEFRVRAVNDVGPGAWSPASRVARAR